MTDPKTAPTLAIFVALLLLMAVPATGQRFRLDGLDGSGLSEADFESGSWVVVVWVSWSPRARNIREKIDDLYGQFGSRAKVCAVHFQDNPAKVRQSFGGRVPAAPVYIDAAGDFSKKYQVTDLPALLVIRDGRVVHRGRLAEDAAARVGPLLTTR